MNTLLLLADIVLLVHVLFVAFVIFGLVLIYIGKIKNWACVRNPWFRIIHLIAIAIVVVQSWVGIVCPLTILENMLRTQAGDSIYTGTFISHWLQKILYYQAPPWVFAICYTLFGILVLISWFWIPPRQIFRK